MKKTVLNLRGELEYISLPKPHWQCCESGRRCGREDFTGVWITGLFVGPRTGRRIARIYSIWDAGNGQIAGETFSEIDQDTYLRYCRLVGVTPEHLDAAEL